MPSTEGPIPPIAHRKDGAVHDLRDHLDSSGGRAAEFAQAWGGDGAALVAGAWHDLGKYAAAFQRMIGSVDAEAHVRVDHSAAGAIWAVKRFDVFGRLLAYVIAGHHAGLSDWSPLQFRLREQGHLDRTLEGFPPQDLLHLPPPQAGVPAGADLSLWVRMLASAVFDADFLDTEKFFDDGRVEARQGWPELGALLAPLDRRLAERFSAAPDTAVNRLRAEVLGACRAASDLPPGLFRFTVPTGGGKTLSALRFALGHADRHGLRRVVYAAPFTSIIEQTAAEFRDAVGKDAVLEHHSALAPPPDKESARSRLAAENWDAPIVVTTTVQLFESLFASRPSRLRKIHNLARSVIILDEAQALPPAVLRPVTAVLHELARHYGATVVLCTATQPSLAEVFKDFAAREIAPDPHRLFNTLDRVHVGLPASGEKRGWADIAAEMAAEPQVLAIVNSRADCRTLQALLPAGAVHLSTYQCARHRARLLAEVKRRLKDGEPVRVVSTSLVEAGVDIDFPVVFRAMAGLDALAQAAGRCNREGRLDKGRFVVFAPEDQRLSGHLAQAAAAAESALRAHADAPFRPAAFDAYFRALYWAKGPEALDAYHMDQYLGLGALRPRGGDPYAFDFRTAAEKFHMIEDFRETVVVPYGDGAALIDQLRRDGSSRGLLRRLQPFTVPVSAAGLKRLGEAKALAEFDGVTVLADMAYYRDDIGLEWE